MAKVTKEFEQEADFLGAMKSFFFFTRRYILIFYLVLGFATVFAVFVTLVSIFLVLFSLIAGEGVSEEFEFTLIVWIFFGLGFQAIMAVASIAHTLWEIMSEKDTVKDEFPETLARMNLIKTYFAGTGNFVAKSLTFVLPGLAATSILVVPMFTMIYLFTSVIEFDQTPPDLVWGVFVPALALVGASVFLMNYSYYLSLKSLKN